MKPWEKKYWFVWSTFKKARPDLANEEFRADLNHQITAGKSTSHKSMTPGQFTDFCRVLNSHFKLDLEPATDDKTRLISGVLGRVPEEVNDREAWLAAVAKRVSKSPEPWRSLPAADLLAIIRSLDRNRRRKGNP